MITSSWHNTLHGSMSLAQWSLWFEDINLCSTIPMRLRDFDWLWSAPSLWFVVIFNWLWLPFDIVGSVTSIQYHRLDNLYNNWRPLSIWDYVYSFSWSLFHLTLTLRKKPYRVRNVIALFSELSLRIYIKGDKHFVFINRYTNQLDGEVRSFFARLSVHQQTINSYDTLRDELLFFLLKTRLKVYSRKENEVPVTMSRKLTICLKSCDIL